MCENIRVPPLGVAAQVEVLVPLFSCDEFIASVGILQLMFLFLYIFRMYDECSCCGGIVRMRQQKLTCRECGLLFHRTCSCKYFVFSFHFAFSANVDSIRVDKHI